MNKERFMGQLPKIDMDRTGARLKIARLSRGLAVKDVQKVIGLTSPQAIYKWESGKSMPTIDNLVILAWLYKVRLDDLIVIKR